MVRETTWDSRRIDTRRRDRFWPVVAGIAVVAIALRWVIVVRYVRHVPLGDDALLYYFESALLAHGHWFIEPIGALTRSGGASAPTALHPPVFVLLLAAARHLGVDTPERVELLCAVIGGVAVVPIAMVGREVGGGRVGIVTAALAAVYVPRVFADGTGFAEVVYIPLIAFMLLFACRSLRRPSIGNAVAFGVFGGLATMTRGEGALVLVCVGLLVVLGSRSARMQSLRVVGVSLVTAAVIAAPWTVYNLTRFEHPVLLATNDGATIAGANCDPAYHGRLLGLWVFGCVAVRAAGGTPHGHAVDESQQDRQLRAAGVKYARKHAGRVPVVVAARVGRTFNLYRPVQTIELDVDVGKGWRARVDLAAYELFMLGAVAGGWVQWRRDRKLLLPFVGATIAVLLVVAVFYGNFRFRGPVDISFVVLSAVALDALWNLLVSSRRRPGRVGSRADGSRSSGRARAPAPG